MDTRTYGRGLGADSQGLKSIDRIMEMTAYQTRGKSAIEVYSRRESARVDQRVSTRRLVLFLCKSQLVTTILFCRLALPFGAKQIPLSFILSVVHLALIAFFSGGSWSRRRLAAVIAVFAVIFGETLVVQSHYSVLSILYVVGIYGSLVIGVGPLGMEDLKRLLNTFVRLAMFLSFCAIVQLMVELAKPGLYLDPIQLLPSSLQLAGYNTTYPIIRGVISTLKPNGMFLLEPAIISQYAALGILAELAYFRRPMRLAVLMAGLVSSFSGTGILILLFSIIFVASPRVLALFGGFGAVVVAVLAFSGMGHAFTSRMNEVARPGTSGFERFVAPYLAMRIPWEDSIKATLFGYGAGQVEKLNTEYTANFAAVPKVELEYGMVGLAAFGWLWVTMFSGLAIHRSLKVALFLFYFVASGSLLQPFSVFSLWGLTLGFLRKDEIERSEGLSPQLSLGGYS